ncbi:isochorismate synthase [[Haemophilus] ducreyi]|uniref:isochorismate synthase n=1 Tax=Haemophilus ducreyi TaxID=730 RepID=UPI0006550191|nr:isochorismate synthase [[Haemophilus] ducreyi]AKO45103.1 isochorismate synthase [[Haemophilus] ducreyi]AKO46505.1 isochorismate synthase [[Haemophilus] ducreyi]AKO47847.1 isochorismate synthase [[Haemophilus] ducreyi]AKO49234.1 isochorismate synthase [[Haemophilus] ducreyi]ANF62284.1 isochorismate synthase [[Haemophilus] ducreyi]
MLIFDQLKQQINNQLGKTTRNLSVIEYQASVDLPPENVALLSWLKAQHQYPHFFWQARDSDLTLATIGSVKIFSSLEEAQTFVDQTHLALVGGIQFEGNCHFLLPRLQLVKNNQRLTAYFYLLEQEISEKMAIFTQTFAEFTHLSQLTLPDNQLLAHQSACDFNHWQHNIEQAISAIQQQQFNKVVLANATTLTFQQPISPYDLLAASQQTNLGCYHFIWAENATHAFLGSSPERLYQRTGNFFKTEALAGTAAVTDNLIQTELNAEWLLTDPKNIYENQLVVDDISMNLADCITQINIYPAEIKRLHNVQHLRRKIRAKLIEKINDANCLARIHPTAAVAGLPRIPAKKFIAENENFTRHWYAGTLGYFHTDHAEFTVTLRSAKIDHNQLTLYAGAGIVAESQADSEWPEIERKSLALARLLKM